MSLKITSEEVTFKKLNVNELRLLLEKKYKGKDCFIFGVETASILNQWNPKKSVIGLGGVLNVMFECRKKSGKRKKRVA